MHYFEKVPTALKRKRLQVRKDYVPHNTYRVRKLIIILSKLIKYYIIV